MIIIQDTKAYQIGLTDKNGVAIASEVTLPGFVYVHAETAYKTFSVVDGQFTLTDVTIPTKAMLRHHLALTNLSDKATAQRILANAGWSDAPDADTVIAEHFT